MRVYIPTSMTALAELHDNGVLSADVAFSADAALMDAYGLASDDDEVAEFLAMALAAEHSRQSGSAPVIVVAADVQPGAATAMTAGNADDPGEAELGRVALVAPVRLADIASFHVGDAQSRADSDLQSASIDASDLGWWAVQELPALLASLE